jgi:hypothetical protein
VRLPVAVEILLCGAANTRYSILSRKQSREQTRSMSRCNMTSGFPFTEQRKVKEYRGSCHQCEWKGDWHMFIKKARDECRMHYKIKHPLTIQDTP